MNRATYADWLREFAGRLMAQRFSNGQDGTEDSDMKSLLVCANHIEALEEENAALVGAVRKATQVIEECTEAIRNLSKKEQ